MSPNRARLGAFAALAIAATSGLDDVEKAQRRQPRAHFSTPRDYSAKSVRCYQGCTGVTLRRFGPKGSGKYTCQMHAADLEYSARGKSR